MHGETVAQLDFWGERHGLRLVMDQTGIQRMVDNLFRLETQDLMADDYIEFDSFGGVSDAFWYGLELDKTNQTYVIPVVPLRETKQPVIHLVVGHFGVPVKIYRRAYVNDAPDLEEWDEWLEEQEDWLAREIGEGKFETFEKVGEEGVEQILMELELAGYFDRVCL